VTLERLFETAFTRGCDISVEYARRTPRYKELLKHSETTRMQNPSEFALVRYLGEKLADRASQNLPVRIKHSLHLWDEGLDSQHKLLQIVMETMTVGNWRKHRKGQRLRKYSSADSVLPGVTKSWAKGKVQPNCLGVAQMLVGLARMVGANHYLVNVLESNESRLISQDCDAFREVIETLEPYSDIRELRLTKQSMERNLNKAMNRLAKYQPGEAHHALVIQMSDDSWMFVDPWLRIIHPLKLSTKKISALLQATEKQPNKLVVMKGLIPVNQRLNASRKALMLEASVQFVLNISEKVLKDEKKIGNIVESVAWYVSAGYTGNKTNSLKGTTPEQRKEHNGLNNFLLIHAMLPPKRRPIFEKEWGYNNRSVEKRLRLEYEITAKAVNRDRVRVKRALYRMIRVICSEMIRERLIIAENTSEFRHSSIEIADPATMLGVATLNHLRVRTGNYVNGRLSVYTSSQWVMLDTLAAMHKGDKPDAESEKVLQKMQKHLQKMPPHIVLDGLHDYERKA
jgi:hypothetical protein